MGLTEEEALERGHNVEVGRQPMRKVGRAKALGETAGFIKFVVDSDTDEL